MTTTDNVISITRDETQPCANCGKPNEAARFTDYCEPCDAAWLEHCNDRNRERLVSELAKHGAAILREALALAEDGGRS